MKITKDDVGKKFTSTNWTVSEWAEVICVGKRKVFVVDNRGDEWSTVPDSNWIPYEEPKKKIRLAPALVTGFSSGTYAFSLVLFTNEQEARDYVKDSFIRWPASENLWIEVEE